MFKSISLPWKGKKYLNLKVGQKIKLYYKYKIVAFNDTFCVIECKEQYDFSYENLSDYPELKLIKYYFFYKDELTDNSVFDTFEEAVAHVNCFCGEQLNIELNKKIVRPCDGSILIKEIEEEV